MTNGRLRKLEANDNVYELGLEAITRNWDLRLILRVGVSSLSIAAVPSTRVRIYMFVHTKT
jgi:hypothetical protein